MTGDPLSRAQSVRDLILDRTQQFGVEGSDISIDPPDGGDPEEALRLLNKALQIDPEMERAIVFRGIAYEKLGLPEKATAEFDRALEINPNSQLAQKKMNAIFPEEFVVDE